MSSTTTPSLPNPHPPSPSTPSLTSSTTPSTFSPTLPHSPETTRQIAEARTFLEASITNIGSSLDSSLKSRAQNLHTNSTQLEKQQKEVEKATLALRKENEKLLKVVKEGGKKVKELGNVQNWAEMLERDFLVLRETVRLANGGSVSGSSGSWETGSEGSFEDEEMGGAGEAPGVRDFDGKVAVGGANGTEKRELPQLDQSIRDGTDSMGRMDIEGGSNGFVQSGVIAHAEVDSSALEDAILTEQFLQAFGLQSTPKVDGEGDTQMNDGIPEGKGKGKEVEVTSDPEAILPASIGDTPASLLSGQVGRVTMHEDITQVDNMEILLDPTGSLAPPEAVVQENAQVKVLDESFTPDVNGKGKGVGVTSNSDIDLLVLPEDTPQNSSFGQIERDAIHEEDTSKGDKMDITVDSKTSVSPAAETEEILPSCVLENPLVQVVEGRKAEIAQVFLVDLPVGEFPQCAEGASSKDVGKEEKGDSALDVASTHISPDEGVREHFIANIFSEQKKEGKELDTSSGSEAFPATSQDSISSISPEDVAINNLGSGKTNELLMDPTTVLTTETRILDHIPSLSPEK